MVEIMSNGIVKAIVIYAVIIAFISVIPIGLWIAALASNVRVSLFTLVGMRLRRISQKAVIEPLIKGSKAGLNLDINLLEAHVLSGGDLNNVIDALIAASMAKLELDFERAAAIDLAGRDVFEAVSMSVTPEIIETPWISAIAANGIEVKIMARVTVRANIERLIGGAGQETIIARVGEGIVTTLGSASSHKVILENPDLISQKVLSKGLDTGTAFEILSIDIADINIGKNIGAALQIEQAEADKQIAQAKAEERKSLAIAKEQEMKALVEEMQAKVVEAESKVPLAMAKALNDGNIGIMDYLNIKNKEADTSMRDNIGQINIGKIFKEDK